MSKELLKRIVSSIFLIPIVFFLILKGSIYFNLFLSICLIVSFFEWYKMSKKKIYFLFGSFFLIFSFYSIYYLRNYDVNYIFLWIVLIICIATDIGGYVFGKIIKGPKLTKISPNKTYAGMFGGLLLSIIFVYLFLQNLYFFEISQNNLMKYQFYITILMISFISQIGDICISFFKRQSNIKNTGKLIPGHGGLLDRIDGMIFAFPFMFIIVKFF